MSSSFYKHKQVEIEAISLTAHHSFCYLLKIRVWLLGWRQQIINFNIPLGFWPALCYHAVCIDACKEPKFCLMRLFLSRMQFPLHHHFVQ